MRGLLLPLLFAPLFSSAQVVFIGGIPDTCKAMVPIEVASEWSACRTIKVPIGKLYSFTVHDTDTTWTWSGWTRIEKRRLQTKPTIRMSPNCPNIYTEEYLIRSCQ